MANNILVIRLSSLGDVILTAPVYKNLKAHWPDCRISVLVKPTYAGIVAGMSGVDEVIPFTGLGNALRRIRTGGFTHLLDLHANLRSFIIRRLCRIPCVNVYRKDALTRRHPGHHSGPRVRQQDGRGLPADGTGLRGH